MGLFSFGKGSKQRGLPAAVPRAAQLTARNMEESLSSPAGMGKGAWRWGFRARGREAFFHPSSGSPESPRDNVAWVGGSSLLDPFPGETIGLRDGLTFLQGSLQGDSRHVPRCTRSQELVAVPERGSLFRRVPHKWLLVARKFWG